MVAVRVVSQLQRLAHHLHPNSCLAFFLLDPAIGALGYQKLISVDGSGLSWTV